MNVVSEILNKPKTYFIQQCLKRTLYHDCVRENNASEDVPISNAWNL